MMTKYECLNLVVGVLTFVVLFWTLWVVRGYAHSTKTLAGATKTLADATKTLADVAVEQLPRPCVVLERSADSSGEAVLLEKTTASLSNDPLNFLNVGTGPAVNCKYHFKDINDTNQLPEIKPGGAFQSALCLNGLPVDAFVIVIEYESVAGSKYRTEMRISEPKKNARDRFVKETNFFGPGLG